MKRLLMLTVVLMAVVTAVSAVPIPCPTTTTMAFLQSMGAEGCISQDKVFKGFSYSGGGGITAADVSATLVFQPSPSNEDIHGWIFTGSSAWTTGFTLSYTISVAPGVSGVAIVQSKDEMNAGRPPNGVRISDVQTGVGTLNLTDTSEILFSDLYNMQSITTTSTVTFGNGTGPSGALQTYQNNWFEAQIPSVPEPVTFVLIGSGLIGLTFLRRRLKKD